ncbi:unnamed protein product [Cunninghamella blakesleeana]
MDENSSPVSTPKSEHSSPLHPSLKNTNIKKSISSPKRSPLQDKNSTTVTLPKNHIKTASPKLQQQKHSTSPSRRSQQQIPFLTKQQQQQQKKSKSTQLLLSPTNIKSKNHHQYQQHPYVSDIQLLYPDQLSNSPIRHRHQEEKDLLIISSSSSSTNDNNNNNKENEDDSQIIKTPIISSTNKGRNLTHQLYKEHQKELENKLKEANKEKESLMNALKKEKGKTSMLKSWCDQAVTLLDQLMNLEKDINDDIDIIKDYEALIADTETEMQQEKKIQDEIDHLMNLIPEKMLEIEDLKDSLNHQ